MKNYIPYLTVGALGLLVLGFILAAGLLQSRAAPPVGERTASGGRLSEQQVLARRRGAMGTAAIAGTTAQ